MKCQKKGDRWGYRLVLQLDCINATLYTYCISGNFLVLILYYSYVRCCYCCLVAKLCLTLCDSMDCSPPGSSLHGVFQARMLEQVATCFSRDSSQPRDQTHIFCLAGGFFTTEPSGKPYVRQNHREIQGERYMGPL